MDRAALEQLDRATLITKAEAIGVTRANILTRPELVDELLVRTAREGDKELPRARGFFGRARDLVARVIEKGLHLPDAAERLRSVTLTASEIAARIVPAAVPTVTLAEIYAAQGHRPRAIETLRRVLEIEPEHAAAQALLTQLETSPSGPPLVPPPPPVEDEDDAAITLGRPPVSSGSLQSRRDPVIRDAEPDGFLDDEPPPARYDVDECVAIAVDPATLYTYWEIRDASLRHVQATRPGGEITLRLLVITPSWDGPRSATRDVDVGQQSGDRFVRDLPAGSIVRAAIGWRTGDVFLPLAHAPALETPAGVACPVVADAFVRWTPKGLLPVTPLDTDYASIRRALGHLGPRRGEVAPYERLTSALGSSDVSARLSSPGRGDASENEPSSRAMI
jgi:hypothetical protein